MLRFLSALVLFLLLVLPSQSSADDFMLLRGEGAIALFFKTNGCVETTAFIVPSDRVVQTPPGPADQSPVLSFIGYSEYDRCTDTLVRQIRIYPSLERDDLQVQGGLQSAAFDISLTALEEVSGASVALDVHVDWEANGDRFASTSHSHFHGTDYHINIHGRDVMRDAIASGTISVDGTEYSLENPVFASIFTSRSSFIEVTTGQ